MAENPFSKSPFDIIEPPQATKALEDPFEIANPAMVRQQSTQRVQADIPRENLPAGMRNNNPGNIKYVGQKDAVGPSENRDQGDPQAVYATPDDGMAAMFRLALKKYDGGKTSTNTLIAANGGWTPGNYQAAKNVAATMGLGPDDDINLRDPAMMAKFGRALMLQEHGPSSKLYDDGMITRAASAALGGQAPSAASSAAPSPRSYAQSVAERLRGAKKSESPWEIVDPSDNASPWEVVAPGEGASDAPLPPGIESKPYLDRLAEETQAGFGDMARSLNVSRWALGGVDDASIAEDMAKSFQEQSTKPKTKAQKEIDKAYQNVTNADGVIDTTVAGAKALWTSLTNPKETSIEIARNAANSLPTMGAGAAGAGTGAAVGAGVGAAGAGIGAIPGAISGAIIGGRAGMALGTTATELGAEIQDMVQKRLAESNTPPTAQNVLAILSDKGFKDAALKQGMAKGLTVAAVDQLFMGLGGKVATAPARKIATRELAKQGMDMATRGARNEALKSAAGQAAMAAAKPTMAARAGAGVAAVGVDSVGESLGEGLSQKVARGEVDYGDALREGVASLGQSVVEPVVGATIETAKLAARDNSRAAQFARAFDEDVASTDLSGPLRPRVPNGPLARATENAAAAPERVTVTAPDGQVSGTVTGQAPGAVKIVGDDGKVYFFKTGPGGVQITPEAPNTPLSNALDVAAAGPTPAAAQSDTPVAPQAAPAPALDNVPEADFGKTAPSAQASQAEALAAPQAAPALSDMSEPELRARLKYISEKAKTNGGWNSMLTNARREVEREINKRAPKVEAPKQEQPTLDMKPAEPTKFDPNAKFDPKGLKPGTPEYNAAVDQWAAEQEEARTKDEDARRRAENKTAVEKRNGWRAKVREWFMAAKHGDTIADTGTGTTYKIVERTRADGKKVKVLLAVDEHGEPFSDGRAATGISKIGDRVEGLDDGSVDPDGGWANPETAGQLLSGSLGMLLEEGEAKTSSNQETDQPAKLPKELSGAKLPQPEAPIAEENPAQEAAAKPAATPAPIKLKNTRGIGVRFHGTSTPLPERGPTNDGVYGGSVKNIYGQGFYTTDAADIASGYMKKGKGGKPTVYEIKEKSPVKLYDMNAPMDRKVREIAFGALGDLARDKNAETGAKITTLSELFDEARSESRYAGISAEEVQGSFDSIRFNLEKEGYRGFTHIGGNKTGNDAHKVNIYWFPQDDLIVERGDISKYAEDGKATEPAAALQPDIVKPISQEPVSQPAPTGGTSEEGAGTSQPTQFAPKKPKTASKEDLDRLFGVDAKRAKALERIAAGKAWFNDGVKAKDFIAKNGLKDTHEAVKGKGGRFEVRAKAGSGMQTADAPAKETALQRRARLIAEREQAAKATDGARDETMDDPEMAAYENGLTAQTRAQDLEQTAAGQKTVKVPPEKPAPSANTIFTEDAAAAARARLKAKLGRLNSGIDPEMLMDGITLAGYHIEAGARSFAAYAKAMMEDLGDVVKPYLKSWYMGVKYDPRAAGFTGMDSAAAVDTADIEEILKPEPVAPVAPVAQAPDTSNADFIKALENAKKELPEGFSIQPERNSVALMQNGKYAVNGLSRDPAGVAEAVRIANVRASKPSLGSTVGEVMEGWGKSGGGMHHNVSGRIMGGTGEYFLLNGEMFKVRMGSAGYVNASPSEISEVKDAIAKGQFRIVRQRRTGWKNAGGYGATLPAGYDAVLHEATGRPLDDQPTSTDAKGNDNGPQKLDQPGSGELAGKQPDAVQGAEPQRQAGDGAQGSGGTDVSGSERAGGSRPQPAGRLGNDAGKVPSLAARRNAGRNGKQGSRPDAGGDRAAKPDSANAERGQQPDLIPESGTRAQDRADGFVITDEDQIGEGGQKTKFKQNVAAIRLLKQLQAENRQATRAEQAVLAKYVGWGGIPQAFYRDNGEVSKGWEKEAAELKELMTADELAAAASSTRNAHYTSPEIVQAVWDAAKHFGFQGGRVLEPSVGVGNFFGLMPTALRSASQLTGVELDHVTGGIAKQLYPMANIQAPVGFQDFAAPDNYFDLAIGNPPFGREGLYDATRRKISGFSIHNYFFAKSIDTVKPNGVLAMVVTNRLLDSMGDKARQYIADRAEFLGAVRLPNDAFLKNAGTQVTTDIIFLRKLADSERTNGLNVNGANGSQRWMDVKTVTDTNGKSVPLNEYFAENPDMMLGEFGAYGSMYSPDDAALVARPGQDTPALLKEAIARLPAGFMEPPTHAPSMEGIEPMHDVSHVKVGSVFEQGGKIFQRAEDMLGKQQAKEVAFANDKAKERVSGMIAVRDALVAVRRLQLTDGVDETTLENARAGLNQAYDAFVKANGPLNADANKRLMRDDPTWPQIAALEDGFDKGISPAMAKSTGEKAKPASAKKAAIFFKRTQAPYKAPEKANSAKDAMVSSLAERGRVDLDYMASLYGKTPEAIAKELDGLIYKNPAGGWESREQYLSGNVKKKLAQAIDAAKADPSLKANVEALRAVQPSDIEAVDIDVKTGAHWVPADVMTDFVTHITEGANVKALYNTVTATWTLSAERVPQSVLTQWGTERAGVVKVLEAAANQKQITIYDEHRDGTRTLNEAATTAANEKVERVKAEWKSWVFADDTRRTRLHRIYNDTFNTDVQRDFDGAHLTFPGKVGNDIIQLRPHQANAVWRMVQSGTTLLDHVVGAGKTFTMIAGIMEMRRMGLAKKPMLVVPNHLVGQWAEDFMKLYPGANILAASKKDFENYNRKKLFARIATGDWDAVIVAHSSFGKVEVEPEFQAAFIKQQIDDMNTSIEAMRAADGKGSRNVKQIEKQKAALEEKLKKLFDTGSKDDNLYFGELGVDGIFLDEAHEFKNLGFSTGMQRVAGLGNPAGSNKAADMFMKVQSVLRRTGGKNVVFATGTPISNTMAEMYTMQRYLDYDTLKAQGIAHFDAWAKTFGEVVTDWELSPSGQYKMNSRFAKFVNMPELMQRYGSFADVINRDDINRQLAAQGKKLPVPKVKTGKPENIVVERSSDQARYIGIPSVDENGQETYPEGSLIWRSENLPKKAKKGADNMLKIMSDARKAALDMRLIDPSYPDNPNSKVNVAARNIKATYDQWSQDKGTQLVFIDLSTPKSAVAKEAAALRELVSLAEQGDEAAQEKLDAMSPDELLALDSSFSVYDDLKAKLIGIGIPEKEIAFIHDANTELQKEDLFGKVRSGRVRILFGSTAKMGAGMNVQDRLVALHHLDAPWRPSDLEQREGRIIRQGNLFATEPTPDKPNPMYRPDFEARIQRYATKQTLDSRMWQAIEAKARFIEQVRKGAGNTREIEDVAGEAANSAEMKAASSGNPLILEEMSLRQAIRKLENGQAEHNREQFRIKDRLRWLADSAKHADAEAAVMEADAPKAPKEFAVTIGNQTLDKHGEAGEAILSAVASMHKAGEKTREVGSYGGFNIILDAFMSPSGPGAHVTLKGNGEYQTTAVLGSDAAGLSQRVRNSVNSLEAEAKEARASAQRARDDLPKLEAQVKPWGHEQDLADAKARHASVIDALKPKKKEQPNPEAPAMSRTDLEPIFTALEGKGLVRKRALDALATMPEGEKIAYIDANFFNILGELDDKGLVDIKC